MKYVVVCMMLMLVVCAPVKAAELPEDLTDALPEHAAELLEDSEFSDTDGLTDGLLSIAQKAAGQAGDFLRSQVRGAASVLFVVILCSAVGGFASGAAESRFLPMAGALSVTLLTAGSLDTLIGLGAQTIEELQLFSKALLPTLAAATAASGAVTTAAFQQVTTVFLVDLLLNLIDGLLMPMVYLYIGALTASACLSDERLGAVADGLKRFVTWILTTALLAFTLYLSVAKVISGSVDGTAVRVAKTTISGMVPVVGGIIAEASETVLAGAGVLKNTIGVFGMLGILGVCALPFLQLGIQYLLYKGTGFLSAVTGVSTLHKLIGGLGGAFGLVLGMTGAAALLLLVSVLSSVAAVVP